MLYIRVYVGKRRAGFFVGLKNVLLGECLHSFLF